MTVALHLFVPDDLDWLVERHGTLYAREEGFDEEFPRLVRAIASDFLSRSDPERERGWIAHDMSGRLGSIFCVDAGEDTGTTAKLRLFLLEPKARGTGLAQQMMDTCLGFARHAGYRQMRLWTHESHVAACRLYQRNGFACIESTPARSFGQEVVSQIWERAL